MSKVRGNCFTISLDGFGADADQSLENPLGVRREPLLTGLDLAALGFCPLGFGPADYVGTEKAAHYVLAKKRG